MSEEQSGKPAPGRAVSDERPAPKRPGRRGGFLLLGGAGLAILRALAVGEKSVTGLVHATGLSQPNVSNHLARLREKGLVSSERQGRHVVYRVGSAGLAQVSLAAGEPAPEDRLPVDEVLAQFWDAALTLREEEAARVAHRAAAAGMGWKQLYLEIFVPTLVRVGEAWERNELSVATEHLLTGMVARLLHRLSVALPEAPPAGAPTALVGCVEGELHTLGGRIVSDFLMAQGWRVWYLNGYLPMEHLLEGVNRHLPNAVVLCISMEACGAALYRTVERLRQWRGEQPLPLLVAGGRYFAAGRSVRGLDAAGTDIESVTGEMHRRVCAIRGDRGIEG
jgi:methanogenic corrinoid protein MtbC1